MRNTRDYGGTGCAGLSLIVGICFCILVIALAMAMFWARKDYR